MSSSSKRKPRKPSLSKANGDELKLDPNNVRMHPERNQALIRQTLEEIGAFRSIAVDGDNVIRAGNGVYEQAKALGLKVRIVEAKSGELVAVKRSDLRGARAVRAALLDNRTGELSEWDKSALMEMSENSVELLAGLWDDKELVSFFASMKPPESIDVTNQITYEVVVECSSESEQQEVFNRLSEMHLKCRLVTL